MLVKINKALLISNAVAFAERYRALAEDAGVLFQVESEWNARYRVNADVVILGSKHLENLNEMYYNRAILILKEDESPVPYIEMGITRFIFDYMNNFELQTALYRLEPIFSHVDNLGYDELLKHSNTMEFCYGDYDFNFVQNKFCYKGKMIYLTDAIKKYLAQWLLNGKKDNSKRMILCNLRKKFGNDFLSDVDRFGQFIGGQNEEIQDN